MSLQRYDWNGWLDGMVRNTKGEWYCAADVDALLAEKDAEIERLRKEDAEIKRLANSPLWELLTIPIQLRAAMKDVAEYTEDHHGDQPIHVLLHSLVVDIPHRLREAAEGGPKP